jgi:hypothetical protein
MKSTGKYALHQSPFWRLKSKSKLAKLFKISAPELKKFLDDENYKTWIEPDGRAIQAPNFKLKQLHKIAKFHFARIEIPSWLISGTRGKSIVDNAEIHRESDYLLNVDITGFYKSTTSERLAQTFIYRFHMADDLALFLAALLTWKGIIPTGSPTSQLMAYWANCVALGKLATMAEQRGWKFSVYVDDLSFSSEVKSLPKDLPNRIQSILDTVNLKLKPTKTKFFGKTDFKVVTGVGISKDKKLVVLNRQRKKIIEAVRLLATQPESSAIVSNRLSLQGRIISAQQIEANAFRSSRKTMKKYP